jgi:hypothetical protein
MSNLRQVASIALTAITMQAAALTPALADTLQAGVSKGTSQSKVKTFFQNHEKVRQATIGAGVGTAAGAVTGLVSGKGLVRGAAIGAGTGATVGLVNSSKIMSKHPVVKDVANGTITAAGLTWSASKGRGQTKNVAKGAAVGAALGLGMGLLKDKLR